MLEHSTVVVVDDEPNIVAVVCALLEDEDFRAVACGSGTKALRCIYENRPNLVVLDVQMPEVDGIQIFQQMRAAPQTTLTPVLFLTANRHILDERLPDYREQNAALLPKPFRADELIDLVDGLLGITR